MAELRTWNWRTWWYLKPRGVPARPEDLGRIREGFEATFGRPPLLVELREDRVYVEVMMTHYTGYQAATEGDLRGGTVWEAMRRAGFRDVELVSREAEPEDGDWEPWRKWAKERAEQRRLDSA